MGSCLNPLDTLFLHPVFALGKLLAPINVDSFGRLSSPSFDIGEVSMEERALERALRGPAFHLRASIDLVGVRLCDNDEPLRWRCRQTGFWSRDVSDGEVRQPCIKELTKEKSA